MYIVTQNVIVY